MKRRDRFTISRKITAIIIMTVILLPITGSALLFNHEKAFGKNDERIFGMNTSRDIYSNTQWYIDNPGYYSSYSLGDENNVDTSSNIDMNIAKAWEITKNADFAKREVVVAVVDTGIDYSHPDLAQNMWVNQGEIKGDHIDNDHNGYVDDVYGWDFYNKDASTCHYGISSDKKSASFKDNDNHGSHIAGIIAAVADNKIGIAGVASHINIKIMTLKINGGPDASGKMSDAIKAIHYAEMMGADICNLSWGTTKYSEELKRTMQESDMLFVAAAGNNGTNNDTKPIYPADFMLDNMITVTSIDALGKLSKYSNYGVNTVEIAAPGNDIYSTIVGGYGSMSGSSMAAPQVTAVAAMLYATNDHLFASNVKDLIISNLKPISDLEEKIKYAGIPDAYKTLNTAGELIQDTEAPNLNATYRVADNYKSRTVNVNASDMESGLNRIKYMQGNRKLKEFLPSGSGTEVDFEDGLGTFEVKKDGTYTVFASDYAGNFTIKSITVKTVKANQMKFVKKKVAMSVGEQYQLQLDIKPYNSTDIIYYVSSNKSKADIDSSGMVTARAKGTVYITAKTRSGIKAICEIKVNQDG